VAYRIIARQRLDKHILAGANARNTRTSVAVQRISKEASLTIKAVFSAWSAQSGYKEVFSSIKWSEDSSFETVAWQNMSLGAEELNWVGSCRMKARKELGCEKKAVCMIWRYRETVRNTLQGYD
jgi:bisphosphoglycerate-independent phosphoglycerate mutase (AlkP superfamily)